MINTYLYTKGIYITRTVSTVNVTSLTYKNVYITTHKYIYKFK